MYCAVQHQSYLNSFENSGMYTQRGLPVKTSLTAKAIYIVQSEAR